MKSAEPGFHSILASLIEADERAAGQPVDIDAWTEQYPQFAEQIRSFFVNRGKLEAVLGPRGAVDGEAPTLALTNNAESGQRVRYFGDYEVLDEIARGGMGIVFKARQVSLNRVVALKMILAGNLAGPSDVQRFHEEAEAAANLDHSHIVPIYEVGEHEGQHYFSMKLIEGGNLSQAKNNRPSNETPKQQHQWAASMVEKIARAVHHAHLRGILHRDLKPGNILLDCAGEPHVSDFGLARKVDGNSDLTNTGAIVGTPAYMAPEQARCEKGLSPAVDVYSLGAILYELLTGQPPFRAASAMETILAVLDKEPASPRMLNPKVPAELEAICLKCLEKQPIKRYCSALDLSNDLSLFLGGEPVKARPPSFASLLNVWYGQQIRQSGVAFLIALLLCLPGVLGLCVTTEFVITEATTGQTIYPSLSFRALGYSFQGKGYPFSGLLHLFIKLTSLFWLGAVGGICTAILKPVSRMETLAIGFACGCAMMLAVISLATIPEFLHHLSDRAGAMTRNILQQTFNNIEPSKEGTLQFNSRAMKTHSELSDKPFQKQLQTYLNSERMFITSQIYHEARFFFLELISVVFLCLGAGILGAYAPSYIRDFKVLKGNNSLLNAGPFDYWMYFMLIGPILLFVFIIDLAIANSLLSGYILPLFYCLFGFMLLGLIVVLEFTLRQTSLWQQRQLSPWPLAATTGVLLLVTLACEFFQWRMGWTLSVGALFLSLMGAHYFSWRWYQDRRRPA